MIKFGNHIYDIFFFRSMFESLIAEDDRNTEDGDTKQTEAGRNQAEGGMRLNLDEDWRKKRKRRKLPDIPKDRKRKFLKINKLLYILFVIMFLSLYIVYIFISEITLL